MIEASGAGGLGFPVADVFVATGNFKPNNGRRRVALRRVARTESTADPVVESSPAYTFREWLAQSQPENISRRVTSIETVARIESTGCPVAETLNSTELSEEARLAGCNASCT